MTWLDFIILDLTKDQMNKENMKGFQLPGIFNMMIIMGKI